MISRIKPNSIILKALEKNPWDLSNSILYEMCQNNPSNQEQDSVLAKTLIIGRVYAAALERGVGEKKTKGGEFYIKTVFPQIASFFSKPSVVSKLGHLSNRANFSTAIELHGMFVMSLRRLRNSNKISFASKYLHFHYPNDFYIFDSRAKKAIRILNYHFNEGRKLSKQDRVVSGKAANGDYLNFVSKSEILREKLRIYLQREHLSIREFDTVLLSISDTIK